MDVREVFLFSSILLFVGFPGSVSKVPKLPKTLIRCHRRRPVDEVNECLRKAIKEGFRQLKNGDASIQVDQFDPLRIGEIRTAQSNGPVNIKITQQNGVLTGVSAATVKAVKINWDNKTMHGEFDIPEIIHTSDQTIEGRVLLFPIAGNGKATIVSLGYKANFTGYWEEYEKNGYHYWKFDDKTFRNRVNVDKLKFNFENLFNGDKRLGDEMNRVLNQNWKILAGEITPVTETIFGKLLFNALNRFFAKVPLEEIFLD